MSESKSARIFGRGRGLAGRQRHVATRHPGRLSTFSRKQKRAIRSIVRKGFELKWHQPTLADQVINSTGVVVGMTDIPQDDTDQGREGDQIMLAGFLRFNYILQCDLGNDAVQQTPNIRVVLFQWHPQTISGGASEPTLAQLFNNGPSGAPDVLSFFNHDNRFMYTIIYDKLHKLVGPGTATTNAYNPIVTLNRKLAFKYGKRVQRKLQYSAGTSTTASNHLYICYLADVISDAQNPTITWNAKIVYHDN